MVRLREVVGGGFVSGGEMRAGVLRALAAAFSASTSLAFPPTPMAADLAIFTDDVLGSISQRGAFESEG